MRINIIIIGIFAVLIFFERAYFDFLIQEEKTKREMIKKPPKLPYSPENLQILI